jgi:hypothetical protein
MFDLFLDSVRLEFSVLPLVLLDLVGQFPPLDPEGPEMNIHVKLEG